MVRVVAAWWQQEQATRTHNAGTHAGVHERVREVKHARVSRKHRGKHEKEKTQEGTSE